MRIRTSGVQPRFVAGCGATGAAAPDAPGSSSVRPRRVADRRRQRFERRRAEQRRQRQIDAPHLPDARKQPHRDQRVTAEIEEGVLQPDAFDAEQLAPHAGELLLDLIARRVGCAARARPTLGRRLAAAPVRGSFRRAQLRDHRVEIERRHEHLDFVVLAR